ncbi:hypothetical protein V5O48_011934 [Marasmius crinis-equi]|uniref:PH domain-containing protein n=1 Tax=Marasmius crinis-equi TaxID=585013 RepID=A0ABR3F457_9AGAR
MPKMRPHYPRLQNVKAKPRYKTDLSLSQVLFYTLTHPSTSSLSCTTTTTFSSTSSTSWTLPPASWHGTRDGSVLNLIPPFFVRSNRPSSSFFPLHLHTHRLPSVDASGMQELPSRSQSALHTRSPAPPSSFQFKASRILQKVTSFRGKIKLTNSSSRKSHDDSLGNHPYNAGRHRASHSMDLNSHIAAKPYMSQPMLSLHQQSNPRNHLNQRNNDLAAPNRHRASFSSQSESSAGSSPVHAESALPEPAQKHTIAMGLVNGTTTAVSVAVGSQAKGAIEGLPPTVLSSSKQPQSGMPQPSQTETSTRSTNNLGTRNEDGKTRARAANEKRAESVGASSDQHTPQMISKAASSAKGKEQAEITAPSTTSSRPRKAPAPEESSRPSTSMSALSTSTASSTTTVTPRTYRAPEAQHQIPPVPPIPRPDDTRGPSTSSSALTNLSLSSSSEAASFASSIPRTESPVPMAPSTPQVKMIAPPTPPAAMKRRSIGAPQLNFPLPGHKRFSLTDGDSARLSPSIIIRQPAWPILHLPPSTPTTNGRSQTSPGSFDVSSSGVGTPRTPGRRMSASSTTGPRLRHMPALSMNGNGEPEEADEEDLAEDSESSDEEEGGNAASDDEGEDDGYQSARTSTSLSEEQARPIPIPPIPPSKEDAATPKARTPRFGQLGSAADYFSGVFSSTPSTSKTPKPQASFYVTPASTPFIQPSSTPSTKPPTLPALVPTASLSFPAFDLSPSTPTGRKPFNAHKRGSKSMFDLSSSLSGAGKDGVLDHCGGIGRKGSVKKFDEESKVIEECKEAVERPQTVDIDATPMPPSSTAPIPIPTSKSAVHAPTAHEDQKTSSVPASGSSSMRRRRSMPLFTPSSPPPPYPTFFPHPPQSLAGSLSTQGPSSSTDADPPPPLPPAHEIPEGREELPGYSNEIYIRAVMPRKMEFTQPSIPAKDRKWRRVICELEGTAFRVYEFKPKGVSGAGKVKSWWERKVGVGDVAGGVGIGGGTGGSVGTAGVSIVADGNGGTGIMSANNEDMPEEERARRRRMQKLDANEGRIEEGSPRPQETMEVRLTPSPPIPTRGRPALVDAEGHKKQQNSSSKSSRFGNFLKPGKSSKGHSRSNSETPSPREGSVAGNETPPMRSSFHLPRPSITSSSGGSDEIMEEPRSRGGLRPMVSRQSLATGSPRPSLSTQSSRSMLRPSVATSHSDPTNGSGSNTSPPLSSNLASAASSTSFLGSQSTQECPSPDPNSMIRAYTLQNAESGLGNDYIKRKNVIRVRMEGEQFLLQAKDVASVVEWIEGLHSAANIALDLDERPMPRGPLFPRRRRRRPRRNPDEANGSGNAGGGGEGNGTTGALDPRS